MVNRKKRCLYTYRNSPISQYSPLNPANPLNPTAVSFVCKTGLTGCSVLAKVIHTFVLGRKIYEIRAICFKVAAETLASLLTV